ncbi:MAG: Asp-tRNA(Asn)/Glu-tRNA(Gln) amidotransferase subunit GatC [Methanoregula sp.]|jgi:aspartyl-tRNA(Asn)/glutamyl-tRNA(Gln) amidotransferase subunit C|nr:Asp-tRNA(Asn)/Glu-tRNA(Gln) amidotransferase subunit GatC [Methanoregula sp.]
MQLSKQEIQHIADLARLELTDEELEKYGSQLSGILDYIDELKEVDTANVNPTAQVTGLQNVMRADEVSAWPQDETEAALGQAPEREGRHIKVKRIL